MRPQNYILALITFPALLISHPLLAVPLDFPASSTLCDNPIISAGTLGTLPSLMLIGSSNEADRKDLELRDSSLQLAASGQVSQALQVAQTFDSMCAIAPLLGQPQNLVIIKYQTAEKDLGVLESI